MNDRSESGRDRDVRCVRDVGAPINSVSAHTCSESLLNLITPARELDPTAAPGSACYLEALLLQPFGDLPNILWRGTKSICKLFGGQPLVILRRAGVLLVGNELLCGIFLCLARTKSKQHSVHRQHAI